MSWKLVDCPKTVQVTRELALEFSDMEPAPQDRPLSERRLAVYERLFKEGKFRPVTWAKAFCKETNGLYRVNGKHTSTLLSGFDYLPEFYVTIESYECEYLEDVAKLYSTFDSSVQSRTSDEIAISFAGTVPELRGLDKRLICTCASGLGYAKHGGDVYRVLQPADRAELLLENPEFIVWLHEFIKAGPSAAEIGRIRTSTRSAHILRQPVVAAIFRCWDKDRKDTVEFWTSVRDESGKTPELPDRKLARYLLTATLPSITAKSSRGKTSTREIYVKCIHAWNAWRQDKATNLNYFPDKEVPELK